MLIKKLQICSLFRPNMISDHLHIQTKIIYTYLLIATQEELLTKEGRIQITMASHHNLQVFYILELVFILSITVSDQKAKTKICIVTINTIFLLTECQQNS